MERWPSVEVRVSPQLLMGLRHFAQSCRLAQYVMINAVFSALTLSNFWPDVFSHPKVHFPSCSSPKLRFSCLVSELHQPHRIFDVNRNAP